MPNDIHVWTANGVDQPLGDLLPRLAQAAVQRGNDDIQPRQNFVRIVQGTIGADFNLGALQQANRIPQFGLDGIDLLPLAQQLVGRKPAGDPQAGGVIGDRQDFQAALRAASAIWRIERLPSLQVEWA